MKKLLLLSCIMMSALVLQGCSAVMALNGEREPNFEVIKKGQNKVIVEAQPLKPISTEVLSNGNILSTYQYTVGNQPSYGRAGVYVLLDMLTFFISEVVTMPIEMSKHGELRLIKIEYTQQGEIVKIG